MKPRRTVAVLLASFGLMAISPAAAKTQISAPGFLPLLQQRVQDGLDALDADVRAAASQVRASGLAGAEARQALDRLARGHSCSVDAAIVDHRGVMRVVAPAECRKFEGADLSQQAQVRRLRKTKRPVLSGAFLSVEGIRAVDVQHPVLDAQGKLLGSVSLLFQPEVLLQGLAERSNLPAGWDLWVLETTGNFLYATKGTAIGRNLFEDPAYQPYRSLRALGHRVARQAEGSGTYEFAEPGEVATPRQAFWTTAALHGTVWRLLVTCADRGPVAGFYPDKVKVLGTAATGKEALPELSFPGFSVESAAFLVSQRKITGLALDTPSIDPGKALDFKVHRILCAANKLALENLANLDRLPATGAVLNAIPMLIRDGTGAPVRVYAAWP